MRLDGRVALITGAGTGIGAATARRFAAEGARLVITGRRPEPLAEVADTTGAVVVAGDTTDPDHCAEAVAAARDSFGSLDIVVANAGVGLGGSAGDVDDESWGRTLDVNLTGPLRIVRAALPALTARPGASIVLVASASSFVATPESAAYETTKAGLLGLMRSLAVDYGPRGVRTNAVCPGWVRTPMGDRAMDEVGGALRIGREEAYLETTRHVPLRRPAEPEEVAACCAFLASDDASYVNGAALLVDGGGLATDVAGLTFQGTKE